MRLWNFYKHSLWTLCLLCQDAHFKNGLSPVLECQWLASMRPDTHSMSVGHRGGKWNPSVAYLCKLVGLVVLCWEDSLAESIASKVISEVCWRSDIIATMESKTWYYERVHMLIKVTNWDLNETDCGKLSTQGSVTVRSGGPHQVAVVFASISDQGLTRTPRNVG